MRLREWMNRNSPIAIGVCVLAILIASYVIFSQATGGPNANKAFFSLDDGKSWFADDKTKAAPFLVDGKEALKAYVVQCGGRKSVALLEKYTPAYKQKIDQVLMEIAKSGTSAGLDTRLSTLMAEENSRIYKAPGGTDWMTAGQAGAIMAKLQKCDDGGDAEMVNP